jgi:hypothetical protein
LGPVLACGLVAAAILGCQNDEEIRRFQVPREPRVRLLAAIVPHGDRTWFVKVAGPDPVVEEHKTAFKTFVQSFRFDDKADPPLTWEVPKGWKQDRTPPGKGQFARFATFRLSGKDSDDLELTVTSLGREGQAGDIEANVNRWRGQLGLAPVDDLANVAQTLKVGQIKATLVDMKGTGSRLIAARPMAAEREHPGAAPGPQEPGELTYKVPEGWTKAKPKLFSVATFRTGAGDDSPEVTVTPLKGGAGGAVENLNRWREQVGLPRAKGKELVKDMRKIDIGGGEGLYVEMVGREKAIFGAITVQGGHTWFFKMMGPVGAVARQRAAFETFIRSVQFDGGKGGQ